MGKGECSACVIWSITTFPFGLSRAVEIMGDRLLGPGKERIEWIGTLNPMDSGEVAVRIIWEFPRKVRIEKQLGPEAGRNVEVTVYDGGEPAQVSWAGEAGGRGLGRDVDP